MSWKSIVITGLLCVVASPVWAVPAVSVTSTYNAALDVIEWQVNVTGQTTTGSLAIEAPFTLARDTTGANQIALNLRANGSTSEATHSAGDNNGTGAQTWYYNVDTNGTTKLWNTQNDSADIEQNPGDNPYTAPTRTEGLWLDTANSRLFASLGSDINMPQPVKMLHIASNDGILNWSGVEISENGALAATLTGFYSSILKGDMNGNGAVNFGDLAGFGQWLTNKPLYQTNNPGLDGEARADMNNNGLGNFGDLAGFGSCLTSPGTCPVREQGGAGAGSGGVAAAGVPEPSSVVLLAAAMLALIGFSRRNK